MQSHFDRLKCSGPCRALVPGKNNEVVLEKRLEFLAACFWHSLLRFLVVQRSSQRLLISILLFTTLNSASHLQSPSGHETKLQRVLHVLGALDPLSFTCGGYWEAGAGFAEYLWQVEWPTACSIQGHDKH